MTNPLIAARDTFLETNPERRITVNSREWGGIRAGQNGPALALNPARAFCFSQASHFPYVTRPGDYTAMLREVLGLDVVASHWPQGQETRI